jgi:hypothetical protein
MRTAPETSPWPMQQRTERIQHVQLQHPDPASRGDLIPFVTHAGRGGARASIILPSATCATTSRPTPSTTSEDHVRRHISARLIPAINRSMHKTSHNNILSLPLSCGRSIFVPHTCISGVFCFCIRTTTHSSWRKGLYDLLAFIYLRFLGKISKTIVGMDKGNI